MNMLPLLLAGAFAAIAAVDLVVLRATRRFVQVLGRRLRILAGLIAWLVQTALFGILLVLLTGSLLPESVIRSHGTDNLAWIEACAAVAIVVALLVLARSWGIPTPAQVGLLGGGIRQSVGDVVVGLLLGIAGAAIPLLAGVVGGWVEVTGVDRPEQMAVSLGIGAVFFAATGVFEELVFRGALFALVARIAGLPAAWALSLLVFGLLHGLDPAASPLAVLGVIAAGVTLTAALLRTGSLWLSIGLHTAWNWGLGCLYGFAVSGLGLASVLRVETRTGTPDWISGGGFGPEASIPGIAAFALVLLAISAYTGRRNGMAALFPMAHRDDVQAGSPGSSRREAVEGGRESAE